MSTLGAMDPGALLPWYVNGTLTDSERHEVDSWLRVSTDGQAELLLWRAVQLDTRDRSFSEGGADLGWRRLRTQLPERVPPVESALAPEAPRAPHRRPWLWAAAASVVAILGLQTALLLRGPMDEIHRPLSVPGATEVWRVQLRFVDSASVAELNGLLVRYQASISEGPSALGIYTVSVPRTEGRTADTLLAALSAEPMVLQVSVTP